MTVAKGSGTGAPFFLRSFLRELSEVDKAVYGAIARQPTPHLDRPVSLVSQSANYSRIWIGAGAVLYLFGGSSGRRAATRGLGAVALASVTVNVLAKSLYRRRRPVRDDDSLSGDRLVRMP